MNNETIGQTAEQCVCNLFNLNSNINELRINKNLLISLQESIKSFLDNHNEIKIIKSIGYQNTKVDFICENNKTLSLKTLKRKEGKICPQGGQPTLKSFDKMYNLDFEGKLDKNKDRFEYIKTNLHSFMNNMLINTYCCDYLIIISNCIKKPYVELLKKPDLNYFKTQNLYFTKDNYIEKWNPKKNKTNEFSTTLKTNINGKPVSIGEFQFHKNSRQQVKFRFFKKFLEMI